MRFHRHRKSSRCEVQFISLGKPLSSSKSSSFLPKVLREKNIRQIDSNGGRSSVKKMGFTQLKWSSSQLTRDHFSRDDHPLVFKLGSETVVKSSCFTIIDYLPKRRRKDLHFNCSKTLRPSKRFFPVRKKIWILIPRCLLFLTHSHTQMIDRNESKTSRPVSTCQQKLLKKLSVKNWVQSFCLHCSTCFSPIYLTILVYKFVSCQINWK